jgi:hypothetical protein
MRQLLSLRAYADHRGVNLSAVQKAIKANRITTVPDEKGRAKIDPVVADIQWAQNTNALQQERGSFKDFEKTQANLAAQPGDNNSPTAAPGAVQTSALSNEKARSEKLRSEMLELNLAQKRGELVKVEDVARALASKLKSAQEHLSGLADRLAPILAAETNVVEIDKILREEHHRAMTMIALEAPGTSQ